MLNKLKKDNKGFTIIEVMIVLAIAGLILLIVFLAVPALQRNARNTTRKNDAANVLAGLNEYVSNNNGSLPTTAANFQTNVLTNGNVKLGSYTAPNITYTYNASVPASIANPAASPDKMYVITAAACSASSPFTPTTVGATARTFVVVYFTETSSSTIEQCTQS